MKPVKTLLSLLIIFSNLFLLCSCWNYRDIEKAQLVSGFSIDKNEQGNKYLLTIELIDVEASGKDAKQSAKFIETQGTTVFDAVRNAISVTGKRLYWAHANVVIISKKIAEEGLTPALDFIIRDAEMREEMYVIISKDKTAAEVLKQQVPLSQTSSDNIEDMILNQYSVGNAPLVHMYEIIDTLESEGISVYLPTIHLGENSGLKTAIVEGTAIFKSDKLIGYLNADETKTFLFLINKFKKGLLTLKEDSINDMDNVTLEVYKSKSKLKPVLSDKKVTMKINIKIDAAIAELVTQKNYIEQKNLQDKLKKDAETKLKTSAESLIAKVQTEYASDIFGFGRTIKENMPEIWKKTLKKDKDYFKELNYDVTVNITIKNSALTLKTIQKGN